jgi:prepilin-type N-terminal cleavage/methylation domain-containing protein
MKKFLSRPKIKKNGFTPAPQQNLVQGLSLSQQNLVRGFTIIELMVAAFVLTVGIAGAYVAISGPIHYTRDSMNKITAAYLAQEGVEIVRNIRDENWILKNTWDTGLACSSGCEAEYNSLSLSSILPGGLRNLRKNDFYNYSAGANTIFKREINITKPNTSDCPSLTCLQVKAIVSWTGGSITVAENLYNWYGQ